MRGDGERDFSSGAPVSEQSAKGQRRRKRRRSVFRLLLLLLLLFAQQKYVVGLDVEVGQLLLPDALVQSREALGDVSEEAEERSDGEELLFLLLSLPVSLFPFPFGDVREGPSRAEREEQQHLRRLRAALSLLARHEREEPDYARRRDSRRRPRRGNLPPRGLEALPRRGDDALQGEELFLFALSFLLDGVDAGEAALAELVVDEKEERE